MERSLLATCVVAGGILIAQILPTSTAKIAANAQPVKHRTALAIRTDTLNPKGKIYNPADFADGSTLTMTNSKNGKTERVYLFKRDGTLYQVNVAHGQINKLYVNAQLKPVSQYQDKVDELMDEFDNIAPPVPPVAPIPAMAGAPAAPAAPVIASVRVSAPRPAVAPVTPAPVVGVSSSYSIVGEPPVPPAAPGVPDGKYKEVTSELLKDGVIKDKDNFDININNEYLKVDGVLQPEELHQKILKKFKTRPGDKVSWSFSNHQ